MTEQKSMNGMPEPETLPMHTSGESPLAPSDENTAPGHEAIARELQSILASQFFRSSKRSQQFLTFVVQYKLDGNADLLKERTIGTELFHRPAGYATGDDSVVRVQAGEVRRRLHLYYESHPVNSAVLIDLPLGSYAPEFHWLEADHGPREELQADVASVAESDPAGSQPIPSPELGCEPEVGPAAPARGRFRLIAVVIAALVLLAVGGLLLARTAVRHTTLRAFWGPALASRRPLLICLPKPISYRPSIGLFKRHTPGDFDNEVDRMNARPLLSPNETIKWQDMIEYGDLGVGKGDVKAAIRLSGCLGKIGKDSEVRIGNDYSFEDLRTSPSVIVGAFSNRWTMEITSNLHFAFAEQNGVFRIQEQGARGRSWYARLDNHGAIREDYGVVTRLVSSPTGQFIIAVAGITSDGSEAAAEMVTTSEFLNKVVSALPAGWEHMNVQIVVRTSVTDSVAGPPEVAAIYTW